MSSLPSLSSSTSLSFVSSSSTSFPVTTSSSEKINPLPLMENLFSALGGSNAEVHGELLETSQTVSQFMKLMTQQFQGMARRIVELESEVIAARAQSQEDKKMYEAQIKAIEQLTATVMSTNQELGALKSEMSSTKATVQITQNKLDAHTHNLTLNGCTAHGQWNGCLLLTNYPGTVPITYATTPPK